MKNAKKVDEVADKDSATNASDPFQGATSIRILLKLFYPSFLG